MFGSIGVLTGNVEKLFCTPVSMTIQDGNKVIGSRMKSEFTEKSHAVRLVMDACNIAVTQLMPFILLPDRYFLTKPVLEVWQAAEKKSAGSCSLSLQKLKRMLPRLKS
jgi:hypothetical protein